MSSISSISASIARLRSSNVRSWIVSARAFSSSSGHLWQVWQALLMLSSGLRTWWSLILSAPTRV